MKRIRLITVLNDEDILFRQLHGVEKLSTLYRYEIDFLSPDPSLDISQLLATEACVQINQEGQTRFIYGVITQTEYIGLESLTSRYTIYRITLQPNLWYLTQTRDNRIYQEKTVPQIIQEVLDRYPFKVKFHLVESYHQWQYCVQFDESNFDFISRLMEKEGIYYWFEHKESECILVLADNMAAHKSIDNASGVRYCAPDSVTHQPEEHIYQWLPQVKICPNQASSNDFDFTRPLASLQSYSAIQQQSNYVLEQYHPLGNYRDPDDGERYVRVMLQSLSVPREMVSGRSNRVDLACARTFDLENYPDKSHNKRYLLCETELFIQESSGASDGGVQTHEQYIEIRFQALDRETPYKAPQLTPTPKANGPHTAIVVGPPGEEIWTDEYGRIKVQFHWDRDGQSNEHSSCWIRVSSPWAGGGFGGVQIPRARDEVIINFIGGHYDRPMVVGRVYNAANMPPINLPDDATKSGVQTRTKNGTPNNSNSMLFDDRKGQETMSFGAERDMDVLVKQNEHIDVDGSQTGRHGGNTDMAVTGTDDNIFKDASTEVNFADATRRVQGASNEFVTGPREHSIQGNSTITMQRGYVKTVEAGLADYTYGSGLTRFIIGPQTHQAQSDVKRSVSADETSQVLTSGYFQDVVAGPLKQSAQSIQNTTTANPAYVLANTKVAMQSTGQMCFSNPATVSFKTISFSQNNDFTFQLALLNSNHSDANQTSQSDLNLSLVVDSSAVGLSKVSNSGLKLGMTVANISLFAIRHNTTGLDLTIANGLKEKILTNMHLNGLKLNL